MRDLLTDEQKQTVKAHAETFLVAYIENGLAGVAVFVLPVLGIALTALLIGGLLALAPFALWFGTISLFARYQPELFFAIVSLQGNAPFRFLDGGGARQATLDEY